MKILVSLFVMLFFSQAPLFAQDDLFEDNKKTIKIPHFFIEVGTTFGDIDEQYSIDSKVGSYFGIGYARQINHDNPIILKEKLSYPLIIEIGLKSLKSEGLLFNQSIISTYQFLELQVKSKLISKLPFTNLDLGISYGGFYSSLEVAEEYWNNTRTSIKSNLKPYDMGLLVGVDLNFEKKLFYAEKLAFSFNYSQGLVNLVGDSFSKSIVSSIAFLF